MWLVFYWLNWVVISFFWLKTSLPLFGNSRGIMTILGSAAGLAAAYMILLQFFFMGRMPWLERVFGLDRLSRMHHSNGKYGLILLALHPVLMVISNASVNFIFGNWYLVLAFVGVILFAIAGVTSLAIIRKKFKYESWYFVHLVAYLAVFFSFWHQIKLGQTIASGELFYWYWIALYATVFGSHIVFRFIRPIYLLFKHDFRISKIIRETPKAVSIYISGKNLDKFNIHSGQFMILRFLTKGAWWQAHPFSLSQMPNGRELRVTIKELGDFTGQVKNLPLGTKVMIDGPYGVFTNIFALSKKSLLIAGGIGITPIRPLAEEMLLKDKNVVILYGNRSVSDIVFKNELESLAIEYPLKLTYVLVMDQERIDGEKIKKYAPDFKERDVFLCGPPPMMDSLIKSLKNLGQPPAQIFFEKFSLG